MKLRLMAVMMLFAAGLFADTTFNVSGTFADGTVLGGTVTIDTTSGTATAANLTLTGPITGTMTVIGSPGGGTGYVDFGVSAASGYPQMSFLVAGDSFKGYTGGAMCGTLAKCNGYVVGGVWATANSTAVQLTSGTLTPAATPPGTPAPPSLWLALLGCLTVLAYAVWARRRSNA